MSRKNVTQKDRIQAIEMMVSTGQNVGRVKYKQTGFQMILKNSQPEKSKALRKRDGMIKAHPTKRKHREANGTRDEKMRCVSII
jgi:hypothetical protein